LLSAYPLSIVRLQTGCDRPPTTVPDAVLKEGLALALIGIPTMIRLARVNPLVFAERELPWPIAPWDPRHAKI
jgi:hypothetical protein